MNGSSKSRRNGLRLTRYILAYLRGIVNGLIEESSLFRSLVLASIVGPGLDNRLIEAGKEVGRIDGELRCRESPGGLLRYLLSRGGVNAVGCRRKP